MVLVMVRRCCYCNKTPVRSMQCTGCRENRYCNKDCQIADWRTHKPLCAPQKKNRKVLDLMRTAAMRMTRSAGVSKLYERYPGYILCLQYVGHSQPDADDLLREMSKAAHYADFSAADDVAFVVGAELPEPSSVVQGRLRQDSLASTGLHYIEIIAWVDRSGCSLTAGVSLGIAGDANANPPFSRK